MTLYRLAKGCISAMLLSIVLNSSSVSTANSDNPDTSSWLKEKTRTLEEGHLAKLKEVQKISKIANFVSDGCSGYQSTSWRVLADKLPDFEKEFGDKPPWEECCVSHDKAYWRGEVDSGFKKRKQADQSLRQCVAATGAQLAPEWSNKYSISKAQVENMFSVTARLMYEAVRIGGMPCSGLPWRWGYGWPQCGLGINK